MNEHKNKPVSTLRQEGSSWWWKMASNPEWTLGLSGVNHDPSRRTSISEGRDMPGPAPQTVGPLRSATLWVQHSSVTELILMLCLATHWLYYLVDRKTKQRHTLRSGEMINWWKEGPSIRHVSTLPRTQAFLRSPKKPPASSRNQVKLIFDKSCKEIIINIK